MAARKVTRSDVLAVLNPIWSSKPETASRVRQRVETVLAYWAAKNHVTGYDNPARWRAGLDSILPKPTKVKAVEHHAALPFAGMYQFMTKLRAREGSDSRALEFAILTATRTTETRLAQWNEFDLKAATWTIPGARMLDTIKDMGYDVTAHGFRSTIRDWIAETTNAGHEVAEMVLGHAIGDKTEAAYRRGDLLQKRAALMEKWAAYCAKKPANVTALQAVS